METLSPSRQQAARWIAQQAEAFPRLHVLAEAADRTQGDPLARSIYQATLRHWLTLEHILNHSLQRRALRELEPRMQAVLLTAAAQLFTMASIPVYAAVDQSVSLARNWIRPGAGGLVNAVLRRLASQIKGVAADQPWKPEQSSFPIHGHVVHLLDDLLPDPVSAWEACVAVATSHPANLVGHWASTLGREKTLALCLHNLTIAPLNVFDEADQTRAWGEQDGPLGAWLDGDPRRRVQDPTAAQAVTAALAVCPQPRRILDYCAGRGTKTRQLASRCPQAEVTACETDAGRAASLRTLTKVFANIRVVDPETALRERYDLIVLDVPCSNTGVLARRIEARYRLQAATLRELVALQQRIAQCAVKALAPGGLLLYTTCSVEPAENQEQAQWLASSFALDHIDDRTTLPAATPQAYHDGGYHTLLRRGA